MTKPLFDDLVPLQCDDLNFRVYKLLNIDQRIAFSDIGCQFLEKIAGFTPRQAFHLTFKYVEWYEKTHPP